MTCAENHRTRSKFRWWWSSWLVVMWGCVFGGSTATSPADVSKKPQAEDRQSPTGLERKPGAVSGKPPVPSPAPSDERPTFVSVSGSAGTFCAVSHLGKVWCGKEGLEGQTGPQGPRGLCAKFHPIPIPETVRHVVMIDRTACALTTTGKIWCWGNQEWGFAGNSYWIGHTALPTRLRFIPDMTGLLDVNRRFCAVSDANQLWCWWAGHGDREPDPSPRPVPHAPITVGPALPGARWFTAEKKICALASGNQVACADGIRHVGRLASMTSLFQDRREGPPAVRVVEGIDRVCLKEGGQVSCTRSTTPCLLTKPPKPASIPVCRDTVVTSQECFGELFGLLDRPRPVACRPGIVPAGAVTWGSTHQALCSIDPQGDLRCQGRKVTRELLVDQNMENSPSPDLIDHEDALEVPRRFTDFSGAVRQVSCARHTCCALLSSGKVNCHGRLGHLFSPDPGSSRVLEGDHRAVQVSDASLCLLTVEGRVRCHLQHQKTFELPKIVATDLIRRPVRHWMEPDTYLVLDNQKRGHLVRVEKTFRELESPGYHPVDIVSVKVRAEPVAGRPVIEKVLGEGRFVGLDRHRVFSLGDDGSLKWLVNRGGIVEVADFTDHLGEVVLFRDDQGRIFQYESGHAGQGGRSTFKELKRYGSDERDPDDPPLRLDPPVRQVLALELKVAVIDRTGRLETTSQETWPHRMSSASKYSWFDSRLRAQGPVRTLAGWGTTMCAIMENGRAFCAGTIVSGHPGARGVNWVPMELPVKVAGVEVTDSMIVFQGSDDQLYYFGTRPELFFPEVRGEYDPAKLQKVEPARFGFVSSFTRVHDGKVARFGLSGAGLCLSGTSGAVECRFWRELSWRSASWIPTGGGRVSLKVPGSLDRFTEVDERRVCVVQGAARTCFGPSGLDLDAWSLTGDRRPRVSPEPRPPSPKLPMSWTQTYGSIMALKGGRHDSFDNDQVQLPPAGDILSAAAGAMHLCLITKDKNARCYGLGKHGQLGDGSNRNAFVSGMKVNTDAELVSLCAAGDHTCARDTGGKLACWGDNAYGQLGTGDRTNRDTPVVISLPEPVVDLQCAPGTVCALGLSGGLFCSGLVPR